MNEPRQHPGIDYYLPDSGRIFVAPALREGGELHECGEESSSSSSLAGFSFPLGIQRIRRTGATHRRSHGG